MTRIIKRPAEELGYHFIPQPYLPSGKDEYYLREKQSASLFGESKEYRNLTSHEIEVLVRNECSSDDWDKILVAPLFNPNLVRNCRFRGFIRIGGLENYQLEYHDFRIRVGLYDSNFYSCDIGDNVAISNVNYLSHYLVGDETILVNINEMSMSSTAKFGNGILKEGEKEKVRIWMELRNENGGRKIPPFENMLPGDAFMWSQYRDDKELMDCLFEMTESLFDKNRGYYGVIGSGCVIKNSKTVKDVWIGGHAYIKGVNKLKNLTIKSTADEFTQLGEGCELVNGIISEGCRIFYGVKAVRFFMGAHSNLKYGARLINSYLGSNATISCCEVLNSLIFPAHEQHHNNSFLCAAFLMGQSNIAAGATIGSNHNSRRADGEIIAGRGFWPGLCVSLKHGSRFASFCLLAKGDYPFEINQPFPFALLINETSTNSLKIMPAYWLLYNNYALFRNNSKFKARDKRKKEDRFQEIEYNHLAPDTINEMFHALVFLEMTVGENFYAKNNTPSTKPSKKQLQEKGAKILNENPEEIKHSKILAKGVESSKREVELIKVAESYHKYKETIFFYGINEIMNAFDDGRIKGFDELEKMMPSTKRGQWVNIGGQLIPSEAIEELKKNIKNKKIDRWQTVHLQYKKFGEEYPQAKLAHALASLKELEEGEQKVDQKEGWKAKIQRAVSIYEAMNKQIHDSRRKDYERSLNSSIFENEAVMKEVLGSLCDDEVLKNAEEALETFRAKAQNILHLL